MTLAPSLVEYSDNSIWARLSSAWYIAKEDIAIHKFPSFVTHHLRAYKLKPRSYCDDYAAWQMIEVIAKYFRQLLKERVRRSPFYGIMVDETTDKSTKQQLIIYIKYLNQNADGDLEITIDYLDLVTPESQGARDITVCSFINCS